MQAPVAKREPKVTEQLGRSRTDDYAWLKDDNWRAVMRDPKAVRADIAEHLQAENAYTNAMLASTEALQAQMFAEMRGRVKEDDSSLPAPDGPWEYYSRYQTGAAYPLHCRRRGAAAETEEVLLDEPKASQGSAFFSVGAATHSYDHTLFAWAVDTQGSEYFSIHIKDLATGVVTAGPETTSGDFCFSPDSRWLFWIWRNEESRPSKVFRRPAAGGEDVLVYEEPDEGFFIHLGVSESRAFIMIGAGDHETSETRLIPGFDPDRHAPSWSSPARPACATASTTGRTRRQPERLVIHTNFDGAVDYQLMWAERLGAGPRLSGTGVPYVEHEPGRFIVGVTATRDFLVRLERVDANNRIVITARERRRGARHRLRRGGLCSSPSRPAGSSTVHERSASSTTPPPRPGPGTTTTWPPASGALRKTQEIPSGHDPARYVAQAASTPRRTTGRCVPITVLMRADTPLDGSAPLLLYGYGSYGMPMEP